jgi:hypothetical protein
MAPAITTEIIAIVSGDQNPVFAVMGGFVGPDPVGVPSDVPVGVPSDVPVGGADGPWVTVNVAVATPAADVAVTVYVSGGTCGTLNNRFALVVPGHVVAVPMFIVPKVTSKGPGNPRMETTTIPPAGP